MLWKASGVKTTFPFVMRWLFMQQILSFVFFHRLITMEKILLHEKRCVKLLLLLD